MTKAHTLRALFASLLTAGAIGVACSSHTRDEDTVPTRELGQSTAALPANPSAPPADAAETQPPPIENTGSGSNEEPEVDDRKLAVIDLVPATGDELGGTMVRIIGRRVTADGVRSVKVYFGSVPAQVLRFEDDETLIVQAPGGMVGPPVDVKLYFEPGGVITLPGAFKFTTSPP